MADRDNARPEFNPKHRIAGAIIIVALVVIVVPMIFSERQPPTETRDIGESPASNGQSVTKVVVTPVTPGAAVESPSKPVSESTTSPVTPVSKPAAEQKPEMKKAAVPADEPAAARIPQTAATEKMAKGWIVQVGTFSNTDNAVRLRDKIRSRGHVVHAETVLIAGKKAMRIRVGPFRDKEHAQRVVAQIHKETGVTGTVLSYP